MPSIHSRRIYFPEPKFQARLLRLFLGSCILQVVTTCAILYFFLKRNYLLLVKYAGLDQEITNLLSKELRFLMIAIGTTFFVFIISMTVLCVFFSHRTAGAIYALKRTIREILDGKNVRFQLRKGDEFQELVDSFNHMVSKLRGTASKGP